jgi:hypothetical protein
VREVRGGRGGRDGGRVPQDVTEAKYRVQEECGWNALLSPVAQSEDVGAQVLVRQLHALWCEWVVSGDKVEGGKKGRGVRVWRCVWVSEKKRAQNGTEYNGTYNGSSFQT